MRRGALFLSMALGLYLLGVVYPVLRLWSWLVPEPLNLYLILIPIVLVLIPAYPRFLRRRRVAISRRMNVFLMTWLGLYFELSLIIYPLEILRLFLPIADWTIGLIALAVWFILGTLSFLNAQRVVVKKLELSGHDRASGKSLAQITDIHIGTHSTKHLAHIAHKIQKLDPDIVLITGDLVDSSQVTANDLAPLREISAPCFYTIGNHERYEDCNAIVDWLRGHGVNVLRNESVSLQPFQLVGIDDAESPETVKHGLAAIEPDSDCYRILLYHRPQGYRDASQWGADLMMCGHTHHGQVFPFHFIVKRFFKLFRGTHDIEGMTLHIGPGTGTWGPRLRLGTRNEIAYVTFA